MKIKSEKTSLVAMVVVVSFVSMIMAGCAMTEAQKRTAIGSLAGAAAGAGIGQAAGGHTESTLAGAGAGAVLGAMAGYMYHLHKETQALAAKNEAITTRLIEAENKEIITMNNSILFSTDSAQILPGGQSNLREVARIIKQYPNTRIIIKGHTDSAGSDDYNQNLSEKRAQAVKDLLVAEGIADDRIEAIGYGESLPIASNQTPEGRQLNRRVEIEVKKI